MRRLKMKYLKFNILILLALVLFSCKKKEPQARSLTCTQLDDYEYLNRYKIDSLCTSDLCINYESIWKEFFIEENNLSESYFNNHIELVQSKIDFWSKGESFRICYKIKLDWAIAYQCDSFIIKIDSDDESYPSWNLPRDTYLSKEEIKVVAIDNHFFSSRIDKLSNAETLKFTSFENTLNFLMNKAEINALCSGRVFINDLTGNLILEAWAQYENEYNKCIQAQVDLITGEAAIVESPCFLFGM